MIFSKLTKFVSIKAAFLKIAPFFVVRSIIAVTLLLVGCVANEFPQVENSCSIGRCINPVDVLKSVTASKVKFVEQIDQKGCGAAAISSILAYWDSPVSYGKIISEFPAASAEGYSVGELKAIASKYNLAAYSLQMTEINLKENLSKGRPIIIAVKKYVFGFFEKLPSFVPFKEQTTYSHFLVVFGFDAKGYWVMDPAEGYSYLTAETLISMWKGQKFVGLLISSKTL